jgi:hypothetical protein
MDKVNIYFNAELTESLIFILVGIAAIAVSLFFLFALRTSFYNGMSSSLILIAVIQIIVGSIVFIRTPKDNSRVENYVKHEPKKIESDEIPRMNAVMKSFALIRWIEIALLLSGVILFFIMKENLFVKGIGLGLGIQAAVSLLMDYFAEQRGFVYLEYLKSLIK